MKGLTTARVVVIDDLPQEAMPIIQALGRLGVGCVHIKGDELESLPDSPLLGIRLVFLDMKLGTAQDARGTGAHTANVFGRVVAPNTAPLLVVLWTRHQEIVGEFQAALFRAHPSFRVGTFFTAMDKPTLLASEQEDATENSTENAETVPTEGFSSTRIGEVKQSVELELEKFRPLQIAWACEQLAHDAATSTTNAISNIVAARSKISETDNDDTRKQKWLAALSHLYRSLILASAGKSGTEDTAFDDLLGAIVEIYRDRLDYHAATNPIEMAEVLATPWGGPDDAERAELNTMFLTARVEEGDNTVRPGNVYVARSEAEMACPHKACHVNPRAVIRELIKTRGYKNFSTLENNVAAYKKRTPIPTDLLEKDTAELTKLWKELEALCIPVLLELTPSCDVAQRTQHVARFAGGLLVKDELAAKIDLKDSSKEIGPIKVPGTEGIWHPIISARLPFSMPCDTLKTVPLFRIRPGALLDVQVWFSSQAARPGYLKADKKQG